MVEVQDSMKFSIILKEYMDTTHFNKGKPEDVNMKPVGLANTRISTG